MMTKNVDVKLCGQNSDKNVLQYLIICLFKVVEILSNTIIYRDPT